MPEGAKTLGELNITVGNMARDVQELAHTVYGNGDEGLKTRMTKIEGLTQQLAERNERSDKLRYAIIGSVIAGIIISALLQVASLSKQSMIENAINSTLQRIERVNQARSE